MVCSPVVSDCPDGSPAEYFRSQTHKFIPFILSDKIFRFQKFYPFATTFVLLATFSGYTRKRAHTARAAPHDSGTARRITQMMVSDTEVPLMHIAVDIGNLDLILPLCHSGCRQRHRALRCVECAPRKHAAFGRGDLYAPDREIALSRILFSYGTFVDLTSASKISLSNVNMPLPNRRPTSSIPILVEMYFPTKSFNVG